MHFSNYINGQWRESTSTITNTSPSDLSDVIGKFSQATKKDVSDAIVAARKAFAEWSKSGLEQRYSILMAIGDALVSRKDELGKLLSREEGKTLAEGKGEVYRSGQFFHYYAAEVLRQMGDFTDSVRPNVEVFTKREPVGVVGVITPWNFPMATAAWKIAPALAYGNTIVFKPANDVPASACALAGIIAEQGLPAGTFNLIMGSGSVVGDALTHSPDIDALTFTGSCEVGKKVAVATAQNLVKCQLEMGSKNALVVLDDADLDLAVECAVAGAFFGTGQKCTASSRLVVTEGVHDQFVAKMVKRMEALVVGDPLAEGVHIGAVANAKQMESNKKWVEKGLEDGAEIVSGGNVLAHQKDGFYFEPTLFIGTHNKMAINREEIFAPLACVIKVGDYEEALAVVNDTDYGLTSGICTTSLERASDFRNRANTGCVMINLPTAGTDYHVPFGGRKGSSFGSREQGTYAKEFYTSVKTVYKQA